MPKNKLFDENDSEEEVSFKTSNEYAKRYDNWREKEELHKLEQKYGDKDLDSNASSSSDSEDEEPPEMPPEMEQQFLKTLALLKKRDPRIYDPGYKFFDEAQEQNENTKEEVESKEKPKKQVSSLAAAFADSDDDDDKDGEIFKVEKKAPQLPEQKEDKLKDYLTGKVDHIADDAEQDLAPLKALWSDPKLNEGEAFLRDYILEKKYLEEGDIGDAKDKVLDDETLEKDEEIVENQGKFERAYNFRFEEPDQEFLKRYPRTMNSIRPKDDRRSKKRVERSARKDEEKTRKMEEIKRLKALKLKEIQEKIAKIKEVTGNESLGFKDEDIEGEFDPEEHDRRMKAIFDEEYYGEADEEKPVFPDLDEELEIENWDNYEEQVESGKMGDADPHCEDDDFNMDADYDPKSKTLMEEIQETLGKKKRNRRKKSKLAALLSKEKPKYVPDLTDKTYSQYMEEYYQMDCEDIIAGELPTRFKYREVVPNNFGLSIEEILLTDDKELNRWASLKKTVKYRPDHVEKNEVKLYEQKAADLQLKKKMLPSLFNDIPDEPEIVVPIPGKNKKKKKSKTKSQNTSEATATSETIVHTPANEVNGQFYSEVNEIQSINTEVKTKKKKNKKEQNNLEESVSNGTVVTEINESVSNNSDSNEISNNIEDGKSITNKEGKKKRKKKKKKKVPAEQITPDPSNSSSNGPKETNSQKEAAVHNNVQKTSNNLKRKLEDSATNDSKSSKKKKNNKNNKNLKQNDKNKKNSNQTESDNPLSKLSDERLKAYGLNPKKYRGFLKYKKF